MDIFPNKVLKGKESLLPQILYAFIQVKNIGNVNDLNDTISILLYDYVPIDSNLVRLFKYNRLKEDNYLKV